MKRVALLFFVSSVACVACNAKPTAVGAVDGSVPPSAPPSAPEVAKKESLASMRASFQTKLVRRAPAPQPWSPESPPAGVRRVSIASAGRELMAWFAYPSRPATGNVPLFVYLHGGFAFGADDFEVTRPFLDAGFAVLTPTCRGENGNPGDFELFLGEVDDALAAVKWGAAQARIDNSRIFVFGHSAGGALADLTSAYPASTIRRSGSAGALFRLPTFDAWKREGLLPFDASKAEERSVRLLVPHVEDVKTSHHAFVMAGDGWTSEAASEIKQRAVRAGAPLDVTVVQAGHQDGLAPALASFLAEISAL